MSDLNYQNWYFNQKYIKSVNIPIELYESEKGDYFMGYADELKFGDGSGAWARLYNPRNSGVLLHVNVWTVTDISEAPFRAQFWFNPSPSDSFSESGSVTPSNTAIIPPPTPKVKLQFASNVTDSPSSGIIAFIRNGEPGTTLVETENGKLIFPPGGSFLVFLSVAEGLDTSASGRVAFGWWEENLPDFCC